MKKIISRIVLVYLLAMGMNAVFRVPEAPGEVLSWSLLGTGYWDSSANWYPAQAPTAADDVYMDTESAVIISDSDFAAQEIFLGGAYCVDWMVNDAIFGVVSPVVPTDPAVYNRRGGYLTLSGTGVVTLKGSYHTTDETIVPEPSFMFSTE